MAQGQLQNALSSVQIDPEHIMMAGTYLFKGD